MNWIYILIYIYIYLYTYIWIESSTVYTHIFRFFFLIPCISLLSSSFLKPASGAPRAIFARVLFVNFLSVAASERKNLEIFQYLTYTTMRFVVIQYHFLSASAYVSIRQHTYEMRSNSVLLIPECAAPTRPAQPSIRQRMLTYDVCSALRLLAQPSQAYVSVCWRMSYAARCAYSPSPAISRAIRSHTEV
jgi:hypothetical protein